MKGEKTSTNPVATIFAWSGALRKRGELDGNAALSAFADALEKAVLDTIASGVVTGDLARLIESNPPAAETGAFIAAIRKNLEAALAQ